MVFKNFFKKTESLVALDIGASSVKLIELDVKGDMPRLVNISMAPLAGDVFANNAIVKCDKVAEQIAALLEASTVGERRVVSALPAPSVFTKKITVEKGTLADIASTIEFEAAGFIPHNVNNVKMDFHIVSEVGNNQLEVLVVAVKNEVVDSYLETLSLAGLEAAVLDIDYFALQNMFEMNYPELLTGVNALVNIGTRYSSINIVKSGNSLFTGDIPLGGKYFTDVIAQQMGITQDEAEKLKKKAMVDESAEDALQDVLAQGAEHISSELNRQLSFFWNASGADEGVDKVLLAGGGSLVPGLVRTIREKTDLECEAINPFKGLEVGDGIEKSSLDMLAPFMSVCVGLGARQPGDKVIPEYM